MTVLQEGERMISAGHYAPGKIKPWLKDLRDTWEQLLNNCKEKEARLQQAYQVHRNRCLYNLTHTLKNTHAQSYTS